MKLELPYWTSHHNMILYSLLHYCEENNEVFDVSFNTGIATGGAILHSDNQMIFLDYSDNSIFLDNPEKYDFYFKRSLLLESYTGNVHPLNLQVNFSYKAVKLLMKLNFKDLINKTNRTEIVRAMDYFNVVTNLSHNAMDVRDFPKKAVDNNGKIIFHSRLWNPDNNADPDEKIRRASQNEFRIEACRIIKKNFKNVSVGIFPDELSKKIAPEMLLDIKHTSKKEYFKSLRNADIGIADDGLKDTPGWKIGEYLLFGKAVVTTPLRTVVEDFTEHINFEKLQNRSAYLQLPEKIEYLLEGKRYLEVAENNLKWSQNYLHPKNYIGRILNITKNTI